MGHADIVPLSDLRRAGEEDHQNVLPQVPQVAFDGGFDPAFVGLPAVPARGLQFRGLHQQHEGGRLLGFLPGGGLDEIIPVEFRALRLAPVDQRLEISDDLLPRAVGAEGADVLLQGFPVGGSPARRRQGQKDLRRDQIVVRSPRIACLGSEELPGLDRQFSINIIDKPCTLGDEVMSGGRASEYLWFSGADAVDPWNSFDAEIEVMLGQDPEHMEPVRFQKPGVVAVPPGFWRGEVRVLRAGKPLCFIPWYQSTKPRYKVTQRLVGGEKLLVYGDRDTITEPTESDELYLLR